MDKEQIDAWNRAAVQDRDVEVALALGTTFVERRNARAREAAQAWFEYATMLDPSVDLLWRITEICAEADHLESARSWMHRAVTTEWAGCTNVVEPTVFPFYDVYDDGNVHGQAFAVQVSATPTEAAPGRAGGGVSVEELGNAGAVSGHIRMPSDQLLGWERTTESEATPTPTPASAAAR